MADLTAEQHRAKMKRRKAVQDQRLAVMQDHKGLVIINTGNGKGKSTAGFGVAFRALGQDLRVAVVQFIKGAWLPGEVKLLQRLAASEWQAQIFFRALGEGFTWETQDRDRDIALVSEAWTLSQSLISSGDWDVVLLDEINVAMKLVYLDPALVGAGLAAKLEPVHVILTGRGAPQSLIDQADLVTEMTLIKHPFREQGIKAQCGIEY